MQVLVPIEMPDIVSKTVKNPKQIKVGDIITVEEFAIKLSSACDPLNGIIYIYQKILYKI